MYFSSEPELQGEQEIQTLDYDDDIFEDVDNTSEDVEVHIPEYVGSLDISEEWELSETVNQEACETLDQSSNEHP